MATCRFHALTLAQNDPSAHGSLQRVAGNQWAKKAESILLGNYGKISVQRLMVGVLSVNQHNFVLKFVADGYLIVRLPLQAW
jgi:hypothetical protein